MIERHLLTLYLRETRDWLSLSDVIVCRFSFLFPITFTFCTSHLTFSSSWWDCKEGRKCSIQLSWLLPLILQWEYNREEEKKMQSRVTGVTLANSRRHRRSRENQSTEPPLNEDHNNYQVIKTLGTRSRLPEEIMQIPNAFLRQFLQEKLQEKLEHIKSFWESSWFPFEIESI